MLFTSWEARIENNFHVVSEATRDRKLMYASETEGKYFSSTDRPQLTVNKAFICLLDD